MNTADPPGPLEADTPADQFDAPGAGIDFADPNSRLAPFYFRASDVVAAILVVLVFVFFSLLTPLWHSDFWGHLKFGEWIVTHHALPDHEPFSAFSEPDQPYIHFQWLAQAAYYLIFRGGESLAGGDALRQLAGGVDTVRTVHGLLVAARFGLLLAAYRRWTDAPAWACIGGVILLFFGLANGAIQRPQVFGELWFAALLWMLAAPRPMPARALAGIALLFALWANTHGSFLVGLALIGIVGAGRAFDAARRDGQWDLRAAWTDPRTRRLGLALVIAALAICANPYGPTLYGHVLAMAGNANVRTITEWLPMDFAEPTGGHWGYLAMLVVLVLSQAVARRPLSATGVLLLVTFGVGPLMQRRLFVWWLAVYPLLVLPLWQDLGARLTPEALRFASTPNLRKTLLALAIAVLAVVWCPLTLMLVRKEPAPLDRSLDRGTPIALALHLNPTYQKTWPLLAKTLGNYPAGRFQGQLFTSEALSDFLIWTLPAAQSRELFVYTHCQVFSPEHWREYMIVLAGASGWWEILERYDVNLVLIEPDLHPGLAERLRDDDAWQVVLDEAGGPKPDPRTRLLLAVRKHPL